MVLRYSEINIFTNEETRYNGAPLYEEIVRYVHGLKIAARCMVIRCIEGCYENGEMATQSVMVASFNMPIIIKIVLPSAQADVILPTLEQMIDEGIITAQEINIRCHKTHKQLIPRHLKVKDMMTPNPKVALLSTPISDVVQLLLSSTFTGVPVVDECYRPVGVISQGDLIYRGGMPVRLGLLAESGNDNLKAVLQSLSIKKAKEIMSPAVSIKEDELLTEAVNLMLKRELKRLPVTDEKGKLTGILSRMDIFRTITEQTPDWNAFRKQNIPVGNIKYVSDIMRRDTHTVLPDTKVDEVLRIIHSDDIQRVAVVDKNGVFIGLISDMNLLRAFSDQKEGIWVYFLRKLPFRRNRLPIGQNRFFLEQEDNKDNVLSGNLHSKTAAQVMKSDSITILESSTVDEAIRLMTERMIKRLPVIDSEGKFKGMISRESLLRTGFSML
ncbi:MAG: DUF190 domain-containing protein [Desulfamplus sp.]|nr:DUF190 domain-containing protein [Desulfamplus sp.]